MEKEKSSPFDRLKESILKESERLTDQATLKFGCHPGVTCFNKCCSDVNLFLTPYDILRLRNSLGINSEKFLDRHTIMPIDKNQNHPVVLLKMLDDEDLSCPFLDLKKGCTVYEDRPWACRMFPVGKASPKEEKAMPFYFFMREDICEGWKEETSWSIRGWIKDQGVEPYDKMGELFKQVSLHDFFGKGGKLTPPQMEMFHMVSYNLDKFRRFVFESSFLDRVEIDPERIEKMKKDDEEMLLFGFEWLRFSLFREPIMKVSEGTKPDSPA